MRLAGLVLLASAAAAVSSPRAVGPPQTTAKPLNIVNTGGKWNTIDITARGPRMTVLINGQKMVDVQDNKHARGPIALQYGAGTVKFKNVRLKTF